MWIINLLPDFFFHIMVIVGIIGIFSSLFLSFLPIITSYKILIQFVSTIILAFGIYFEGAINDSKEWKQKVADMEMKVSIAEQKSMDLNKKIEDTINNNLVKDKERENVQTQIIQKVITKYDNTCKLSDDIIRLHDSASQNRIPDSTIGVTTNTPNVTNSKK
jgi:hypothetical protein